MKRFLDRVAAFVSWHRRIIGALLAASALLLGVEVATAGPPGVQTTVLSSDVEAGQQITQADLATATVAPELASSLTVEDVVGRSAAVSLRKGTVIHPGMLASSRNVEKGRVLVPVVIDDAALRSILTPGDAISLVMVDSENAEVLTNDARVATLPSASSASSAVGSATSSSSTLILVDVSTAAAPTVAALGQSRRLSVVLGVL